MYFCKCIIYLYRTLLVVLTCAAGRRDIIDRHEYKTHNIYIYIIL